MGTYEPAPSRTSEVVGIEMLAAFGEPGIIEKTGASLGIAFSDQLPHGWDLARATRAGHSDVGRASRGPYGSIYGRFTDEQRKGVFRTRDLGRW
jgi:hypothetical protein